MTRITGAFIDVCFAAFLAYWFVAAFFTKRTVKREGVWRVMMLAVLLAVVMYRRLGSPVAFLSAALWPQTTAGGIVADAITLAGLVVVLWARATIGGNWSADVALKERHELIQRGPYARVRHPIYGGLLVMALGAVVWYGRVGGIAVFALLFAGLWFKARREEKLLMRHFPGAYERYRAKTRALIPWGAPGDR